MEERYISNKRIEYIDKLRGMAMLLVLMGHNDTIFTTNIYSFHIPLFFFISGLLHKNNYSSFKEFIKKKFKSIMIPYFILAIILYIIWIPLIQFQGINISREDMIRNFIGIFYSQGSLNYMWWGVQLWFLPCLFITSTIFYFVGKLNKKLILVCIFFISAMGFLLGKFFSSNLLWSFDVALIGVLFYGSGFLLKDRLNNYKVKEKNIVYVCVVLIFFVVFNNFNGRIDMCTRNYNNIFLFIINAFLGIYILIIIAKVLPLKKSISFIGTNTMLILAFHIRALDLIKSIYLMIFSLPLKTTTIFNGIILIPVFEVILMVPIIFLLKQLKKYIKYRNIKKVKGKPVVLTNKY